MKRSPFRPFTAAVLASIAFLACGPALVAQEIASSPARVVDAYVTAYNAKDFETLYDLVAPGAVFLSLGLDSVRTELVGREAYRKRMEQRRPQLVALGARIEVLERIVSDFVVIQRERLTLSPPEEEPFSFTSVRIYRVREGRIIRSWELPQEVVIAEHVPTVENPAFEPGAGPTVWIDSGHNNRHTTEGTYWAFAEMLRRDGFRVRTWEAEFSDSLPAPGDVLVISNALADRNVGDWSLPTPSAFSEAESAALVEWVQDGGRLLLIADHMPFPGAVADLAAALGFEFRNGFAVDTAAGTESPAYSPWRATGSLVFRAADGSLGRHPILNGRGDASAVDSVATFTGQAFRSPERAVPLLILSPTTISLEPDTAWTFSASTRVVDVGGWHQGAALELGQGRVVVLGEAAQFRPGRGQRLLGDNGRFARNVVEWLAGVELTEP